MEKIIRISYRGEHKVSSYFWSVELSQCGTSGLAKCTYWILLFWRLFIEGLDDVYYSCPFGIPEFVGYKEVIQKKLYMGLPENSLPNSIHWSSSFSNINKKWYIIYVGKCNVTLYVTYFSIHWSWPYFWWGTEAPAIVTFQGKEVLCFMARCCQMVFPRCDLCESPARFYASQRDDFFWVSSGLSKSF